MSPPTRADLKGGPASWPDPVRAAFRDGSREGLLPPLRCYGPAFMTDLLDDLNWRGLVHDSTDVEQLRAHLAEPRRVYVGFDPSRDSLTIGNLVPLLLLRRFQLAGHTPVVIVGGGTGLVGDPTSCGGPRTLSIS